MSKKTRKIIQISLGVLLLLALTFLFSGVFDKISRPYRITGVAQDYAVNKEIFTTQKLKNTHEDWLPIGDGQIDGVYQLTSEEVKVILSNKPPIKCRDGYPCKIETTQTVDGQYCASAHQDGGTIGTLCIDSKLNEAHWTYVVY